MAIRTKEEIMAAVRAKIGDSTDDADLSLVEDISDTMDSMSDSNNWKQKYEDNDKQWRQKYRDRFFSSRDEPDDDEPDDDEPEEPKKYTYDSLFKED